MSNIIDNLNILNTNLDNAKFKLAKNLKNKGVQALPSDKLDILADKVVDIQGGSCNLQELNVTTNGVYTPQAGDVKGYNKVNVNVPIPTPNLQEKTVDITANGTSTITPDEGYDGISTATVNVNVAGGGEPSVFNFAEIGYVGTEQPLKDGFDYSKQIYDNWDASKTDLSNKFKGDKKIIYMPLVDTSKANNISFMFQDCTSLTTIPKLDTSKANDMSFMFYGCTLLTTIPQLNTINATNMGGMFCECKSLTTIPQLDTSKANNISFMFDSCTSLTTIPQLNTSNVTKIISMFQGCTSLTTIPQLNTSNVTTMQNMFNGCTSLTSIPQLDTSKVTDMFGMFNGCTSLTTIPQLDVSQVTNMQHIFEKCTSLTTIPQLDTSNVEDMWSMFSGCESLCKITQIDTSRAKMSNMFFKCKKLRYLNILNLGAKSELTNIDLKGYSWEPNELIGIDGDGVTGCRQALIDTLITNSFDRATAGYPVCTITLADKTKALLTEDEKAAITAKGFTIA